MRFLDAHNLFAETFKIGAVEICAGRGHIRAVVDCVDARQGIVLGKDVIEAGGAEVVADGLQRVIEGFRDTSEVGGARGLCGPKGEQGSHAWAQPQR